MPFMPRVGPPYKHPMIQRLIASLPPGSRTTLQLDNPGNGGADAGLNPWHSNGLSLGFVTSSLAASGTCQVTIPGGAPTLPCVIMSGVCGYTSGGGVTESASITEGAHVIVWRPTEEAASGFILGVVPPALISKAEGSKQLVSMADLEPGAGFSTEATQHAPIANEKHANTLVAHGGRPSDDLPGAWSMLSEYNVGIRVGMLMTALRAGSDAAVELSVLDGMLRLVGRHMQVLRADGEMQAYTDHGMATCEYFGSPYSHEVDGLLDPALPRTQTGEEDTTTLAQAALKSVAPQLCTVGRMQIIQGYLAGCFDLNIMTPAGGGTRTLPAKPADSGLLQVHADDSGRMRISSANDIVFERTDRIAVPKKIKEPWDPTGTRAETITPEVKMGFDWENGDERKDGAAASLHAEDGLAWDKRSDMLRMAESKGDYFLPEESDVTLPPNKYGGKHPNTGEQDGEEMFEAYRGRRCILRLGKDGTILLRANDGAEIFLRGDDLRVDTPGNLYLNAGKSVVIQAGHDVVLRAKNSVDISATDHDVRLKAEKNLHAYSANGVLIESGAASDNPGSWPEGGGEDVSHGGVVVRAAKSRVLIDGATAHLSGRKRVLIESVLKEASALIVRMTTIYTLARRTWLIARSKAGSTSSIALNGGTTAVHGTSVAVMGESSVAIIKGTEAGVFEHWAQLKTNPAATLTRSAARIFKQLFDGDSWLGPLGTLAFRDKMVFTFRKLAQLKLPSPFKVATGFWAFVQKSRTGEWKEKAVNDTHPWPATENHTGGDALLHLKKESNVDSGSRKLHERKKRSSTPGALDPTDFSKFPYRK